uniref:hypothetical protein n=1 Tax=Escherichia coli TaxID=562 RepID=UPI001BDC7177
WCYWRCCSSKPIHRGDYWATCTNVRSWHKADTHSNIQKSMTYLLYKLFPSIANNQTVGPEAALVEITACSDPL